jgi:hypothetical protein
LSPERHHLPRRIIRNELLKIVLEAGSYVAESDFFERAWQHSFWGANYPRLATVKKDYDPRGFSSLITASTAKNGVRWLHKGGRTVREPPRHNDTASGSIVARRTRQRPRADLLGQRGPFRRDPRLRTLIPLRLQPAQRADSQ